MSVINLRAIRDKLTVGSLAIGNFDGVHLGHQELLKCAVSESEKFSLDSGVLTFSPHPKEFFEPSSYTKIFQDDQNYNLMSSFGISKVFVQDFKKEISVLSAQEFLSSVLEKIDFKVLVVGFDFKLGKGRGGDHKDIKIWCNKHGISFKVIPSIDMKEKKISSSLIKTFLEKGDVAKASSLLGFKYSHQSSIKADQGLGSVIGYPTLNMHLDANTNIKKGVYATKILLNEKMYEAISNIGFRPTVSNQVDKIVLETHILDKSYSNSIKCKEAEVFFETFIRSEKKFANIDELKAQIYSDIKSVQDLKS